jgi:type II secretory pathway pseudopilin PulG
MLGLSVGKFLLLALLCFVVWTFFRYRARIQAVRQAFAEMQRQAQRAARGGNAPPSPPVSLQQCAVCGSYVAADASSCGRNDCPRGRPRA